MPHAALTASSLATAEAALRLMTVALVATVLASWLPSWWRTVRKRAEKGDAGRMTGVMLAVAVLIFEIRVLWPGMTTFDRALVGCIAHVVMLSTLLAKIYVHGQAEIDSFRPRRAALVHLAMLGLSLGAVVVMR